MNLLPSIELEVVAVSHAASPESSPDSLRFVNATVGIAPNVVSMIDHELSEGVTVNDKCNADDSKFSACK